VLNLNVFLVFTSSWICVHSFYHVEQLLIEYMISMAAAIKSFIIYGLLSIHEKLDNIIDTRYDI